MHEHHHVAADQLEFGVEAIKRSPATTGVLRLIVCRPDVGARETMSEARLDEVAGLIGDSWLKRGSSRTPDRSANPDAQITVMNARAIALVAASRARWPLAGDQLFVDLDLSTVNLPTGSRLRVGEAVIEISTEPHTGCYKFKDRFGAAALAWVNSPVGRELNLRGVNARIVTGGIVRVGDPVVKLCDD
ncbi:MAG: MOSC domain-containing protein [Chthoniobacteraceae bacterium]